MTTILGNHIRLIRPERISKPIISRTPPKYNKRPKMVKNHCGKVTAICVQLYSGMICSLLKGTHLDIIEKFDLDIDDVKRTGWELEGGTKIWR